jgi:hypothetical protein
MMIYIPPGLVFQYGFNRDVHVSIGLTILGNLSVSVLHDDLYTSRTCISI